MWDLVIWLCTDTISQIWRHRFFLSAVVRFQTCTVVFNYFLYVFSELVKKERFFLHAKRQHCILSAKKVDSLKLSLDGASVVCYELCGLAVSTQVVPVIPDNYRRQVAELRPTSPLQPWWSVSMCLLVKPQRSTACQSAGIDSIFASGRILTLIRRPLTALNTAVCFITLCFVDAVSLRFPT